MTWMMQTQRTRTTSHCSSLNTILWRILLSECLTVCNMIICPWCTSHYHLSLMISGDVTRVPVPVWLSSGRARAGVGMAWVLWRSRRHNTDTHPARPRHNGSSIKSISTRFVTQSNHQLSGNNYIEITPCRKCFEYFVNFRIYGSNISNIHF